MTTPQGPDRTSPRTAGMDKNPAEVASMFDQVAPRYDLLNDILALGQTRGWRRATVAAVDARPGERVLDLAAGTGTSSEPYADAGIEVVAGDISEGMLAVGRERRPDIEFVYADALDLPFEDESFDVVTISYGLRNVQDTSRALAEMLRVLKPGGRVVVAEFSRPVNPLFRTVYIEYLMRALPAVARAVSPNPDAYVYLADTIREWPGQEELAQEFAEAGFQDVEYRNLTGGIVALHRAVKPAQTGPGAPTPAERLRRRAARAAY
ncbi:demethylmenaquinone methyltransferase [Falsarthrobacter nasiphocae]|uniref:Demethylmenaquinone methyltransferase n=1 Tax=Falsarthrobacter nasiphocae TaxID=189863 RepID=A0AAE4C7D2_9MICC|nr:demethylmenaquinone methyltransferase [Falsarthrobacter nasiphocae]MDR6892434.1 demethylmenaquinone methyltransferase/2-methoxy-6-polyprenyl-1,4-benzoquinol methylase [Falsarthrobacter nasiphocae]